MFKNLIARLESPRLELYNEMMMKTLRPSTVDVIEFLHSLEPARLEGKTVIATQPSIAEDISYSRPTVKYALQQLEAAGFLTPISLRGYQLHDLTEDSLERRLSQMT